MCSLDDDWGDMTFPVYLPVSVSARHKKQTPLPLRATGLSLRVSQCCFGAGSAPVVSAAAAATAPIVPGAGVVDAEIATAHVAVAGLVPIAVFGRWDYGAFTSAAIQEVMGQLFARNYTGAHCET
jgi:hypothetical protein